jgi:hypothetical protein
VRGHHTPADGIVTNSAKRWLAQMQQARIEGALSAYSAALDWLRRYPGHAVEERLIEAVERKRADLANVVQKQSANG